MGTNSLPCISAGFSLCVLNIHTFMDTIFDTPAVDLIGDNDGTPVYYWLEDEYDQEEYDLTPAYFG